MAQGEGCRLKREVEQVKKRVCVVEVWFFFGVVYRIMVLVRVTIPRKSSVELCTNSGHIIWLAY